MLLFFPRWTTQKKTNGHTQNDRERKPSIYIYTKKMIATYDEIKILKSAGNQY